MAGLTWEDVPNWRGGTPRYFPVLDRKVAGRGVMATDVQIFLIARRAFRTCFGALRGLPFFSVLSG
jgi:hypothetical protein